MIHALELCHHPLGPNWNYGSQEESGYLGKVNGNLIRKQA
jgi:hypothetical protein